MLIDMIGGIIMDSKIIEIKNEGLKILKYRI